MSIGRLFSLCMMIATLVVVLVAGQSLVRETADYRARSRAIDAGHFAEDHFRDGHAGAGVACRNESVGLAAGREPRAFGNAGARFC